MSLESHVCIDFPQTPRLTELRVSRSLLLPVHVYIFLVNVTVFQKQQPIRDKLSGFHDCYWWSKSLKSMTV